MTIAAGLAALGAGFAMQAKGPLPAPGRRALVSNPQPQMGVGSSPQHSISQVQQRMRSAERMRRAPQRRHA